MDEEKQILVYSVADTIPISPSMMIARNEKKAMIHSHEFPVPKVIWNIFVRDVENVKDEIEFLAKFGVTLPKQTTNNKENLGEMNRSVECWGVDILNICFIKAASVLASVI